LRARPAQATAIKTVAEALDNLAAVREQITAGETTLSDAVRELTTLGVDLDDAATAPGVPAGELRASAKPARRWSAATVSDGLGAGATGLDGSRSA